MSQETPKHLQKPKSNRPEHICTAKSEIYHIQPIMKTSTTNEEHILFDSCDENYYQSDTARTVDSDVPQSLVFLKGSSEDRTCESVKYFDTQQKRIPLHCYTGTQYQRQACFDPFDDLNDDLTSPSDSFTSQSYSLDTETFHSVPSDTMNETLESIRFDFFNLSLSSSSKHGDRRLRRARITDWTVPIDASLHWSSNHEARCILDTTDELEPMIPHRVCVNGKNCGEKIYIDNYGFRSVGCVRCGERQFGKSMMEQKNQQGTKEDVFAEDLFDNVSLEGAYPPKLVLSPQRKQMEQIFNTSLRSFCSASAFGDELDDDDDESENDAANCAGDQCECPFQVVHVKLEAPRKI